MVLVKKLAGVAAILVFLVVIGNITIGLLSLAEIIPTIEGVAEARGEHLKNNLDELSTYIFLRYADKCWDSTADEFVDCSNLSSVSASTATFDELTVRHLINEYQTDLNILGDTNITGDINILGDTNATSIQATDFFGGTFHGTVIAGGDSNFSSIGVSNNVFVGDSIYASEYLSTAYLIDRFGLGGWDMRGDPYYLSGVGLQLAETLIVGGDSNFVDVGISNDLFVDENAYIASLTVTEDSNFSNLEADYFFGNGSTLLGIPIDVNGSFVPYIGADYNVDLGNYNLTTNAVTLTTASQDYTNIGRSNAMGWRGQSSANAGIFEFWSKDSDGTDNLQLNLFGLGNPEDIGTGFQLLQLQMLPTKGYIRTLSGGTGVAKPLELSSGAGSQLVLGTNGGVGINRSPVNANTFEVDSVARFFSNTHVYGHSYWFDNSTLNIGNSNDMQLYHDGSTNFITHHNDDLYIYGNNADVIINPYGGNTDLIIPAETGYAMYVETDSPSGGHVTLTDTTIIRDLNVARDLNVYGGVSIGDNTDFCEFQTDGEIILHGTARVTKVVWFGAGATRAAGLKPASFEQYGLTGVWVFDDAVFSNEESISGTIKIPNDMDKTVAPTFHVGWSTASAGAGDCNWYFEYLWLSPNEATNAAGQEALTITPAASGTGEGFVLSTITGIDLPSATDQAMLWRLTRGSASAGDTIADTVELRGNAFTYTANKLGTAT